MQLVAFKQICDEVEFDDIVVLFLSKVLQQEKFIDESYTLFSPFPLRQLEALERVHSPSS